MSRLNPLQINLKEIAPEGQDFSYSNKTAELTPTLKELIGSNPYSIELKITPMGNTFDLRGSVRTAMDLQCSLCAVDFNFPVELKLHELIVVTKKAALGKGDHSTRANHAHEWETEGPECILLESDLFNIAEYVHEMVALAEPIRPLGKPDCSETCENWVNRERRPWLSYGDEPVSSEGIKANPFKVLENIKLKG